MKLTTILATVIAILVGASGSRAQSSDVDKVKALNEAFDAALSRRDMSAIDAAWAHDATVTAFHPPSKSPVVGWEAVRKSWEGAFNAFPELSVTLQAPVVRVMGNAATVVGVEVVRGKRASGEVVEFNALTTNVYEKQGERWLMVHHQASRAP